MSDPAYPLRFAPVYKDYLWGGDRIPKLFQRDLPPGIYAESWELSDRPAGMSVVTNGALAGRSLRELCETIPEDLLGARRCGARFPLLVKIIDARLRASVQVHPDARSAAATKGEPKTEMWYVLAAEPGARVYAGFRPGVGRADFERAMKARRLPDLLDEIPVSAGDAVLVPGGLVHAIGEGCLMVEVQQNSETTYRLYDWDRVGPDGKSRKLHLAEAETCIGWNLRATIVPPPVPGRSAARAARVLVECEYFRVEEWTVAGSSVCEQDGGLFQAFFVASGSVEFRTERGTARAGPGTSVLLPAAVRHCEIQTREPAMILRILPR